MYALSYDMQVKPRPSEGKPWLKYFSPEAVAAPLPQDTLYGYLVAQNGAYPDNAALNYYGNRIPFGRALREIDRTADAYQALGVLPGEIVTCCSLAIPETVYSLYGLNKIGGVSNMIDPRASSKGIRNFVAETGSRVLVILDAILEKNLDMLPELDVDTIIVQTAERSLPPMVRLLKRLKDGAVRLPADKRIVYWDDFLRAGAGANAQPVPYRENMLAVINHTGGTTGVPKGVMLTNDGMNAMSVNFGLSGVNYSRDNRFLDIIPPFASYGVVCSLHVPFSLAGGRAHPAVRPGEIRGHGPALPPDAHAGCPVALRAADERRADPKNGPVIFRDGRFRRRHDERRAGGQAQRLSARPRLPLSALAGLRHERGQRRCLLQLQ